MALRADLTAGLISGAFAIGSVAAALAQTIVEAKTWDEAISKLDCDKINRNADGSFSITAVIKINGETHHDPIINVPKYTAEVEAKNCADRETSRARL
jgi:hypothetical protein